MKIYKRRLTYTGKRFKIRFCVLSNRMSSMLQLVRQKHAILCMQRKNQAHHVHTQMFAGNICPPTVIPLDRHSGVDSVLLANMAQLLDAIYIELAHRNPTLKKTSRLELMNQLEGSGKAYEHPIFCALCDELSPKRYAKSVNKTPRD